MLIFSTHFLTLLNLQEGTLKIRERKMRHNNTTVVEENTGKNSHTRHGQKPRIVARLYRLDESTQHFVGAITIAILLKADAHFMPTIPRRV